MARQLKSTSKFNFSGVKLLLTYPTQIDKDDLIAHIENSAGRKSKFIRVAHESGNEETPYPHCHVLVRWFDAVRTKDERFFDIKIDKSWLHPNWKKVNTEQHWLNAVKYLAKEDPDNADLLIQEVSCCNKIWEAESLEDALRKSCIKPSDALGVIALYNARPAAPAYCKEPDRPWQISVLEFINSYPDGQSVHWITDPTGGAGKSTLARYTMINKIAHVVKRVGGASHFATNIANAIATGWTQQCLIIDVPRGNNEPSSSEFYACIEEVLDGVVTATKYQGGTLIFDQPHVIVLANVLPCKRNMSARRWKCHTIDTSFMLTGDHIGSPSGSTISPECPEASPPSSPVATTLLPAPPVSLEESSSLNSVVAGGLTLIAPPATPKIQSGKERLNNINLASLDDEYIMSLLI